MSVNSTTRKDCSKLKKFGFVGQKSQEQIFPLFLPMEMVIDQRKKGSDKRLLMINVFKQEMNLGGGS